MDGTASTVRNWMLLEAPGAWGPEALASPRVPEVVRGPLRERAAAAGVRIVLIRRVGRAEDRPRRVYLAHTGPDAAWMERAEVSDPTRLLDADLEALGAGRRPGFGEPDPGPVHLVCTHGRRDPCCAEQGRPLAAALAGSRPDTLWASSHIGGDRFAGNLVCFPHGLYFGRLDPAAGRAVAETYERGHVALEHYRGRSCYGFAVQAAEAHLRRRTGATGVDAIRLVATGRSGPHVEARFEIDGRAPVTLRVHVRRGTGRPLTCHADGPGLPRTFTIEG